MDTHFTKLEEASKDGDVNLLKELLKNDNLLLEKVTGRTSVSDNPLHIAAMLGHADFVREVIHHKSDLAKELNDQGLPPLHLAAAYGHVTVVKELLKVDLDLCLLSEKQEGLLPLHIAVKKRRTVIVKELVEACEQAVHRLTNSGETILHLAIKYNLFDTVEFLIDRVQDLNAKDDRGNTILHHAVASKQLSVIKCLLSKVAIDVNTMNLASLTPLDVLLGSWPQNGDLLLGEKIRAAGGKTAAEVLSESLVLRDTHSSDSSNPIPIPKMPLQQIHCRSTKNDIQVANLELKSEKKEKTYDPQILLLVATLVATITFQAALNPPGGSKSDEEDLDYFVAFDMLALFLSISVMMLLLCVVPRNKKFVMKLLVLVIWAATFSMGLAFTEGIYVLYDEDDGSNDHWYNLVANTWYIVLRIGISWVLLRFFIFLMNKSGLREPLYLHFDSLKGGCFLKWQQFSNSSGTNGSNCCQLFKMLIFIVLMLGVLVGITAVWVSYMYIPIWE